MPHFSTIDDFTDTRVESYRAIRDRDLVGRRGVFIAEGEVVLRHLVQAQDFRCLSVLIDPKRLDKLSPMLKALPADIPVFLAGQAVLNAVAGFDIHRGVLALGERREAQSAPALLARLKDKARASVVVLSGIANHDNMGGVFRNAAAFGADAVLLDPYCCDPLYRKAIRVSVGAALRVPFARFAPEADMLACLEEAGFEPLALTPSGAETLSTLTPSARTAVLLGAEGPGLDPDLMRRARTLRIPMADGFDSLNVATTSALVLHHLKSF